MQGLFWIESRTYGFSWDGAELTDFDFGKISQFSPVPIKPSCRDTLLVKVGDGGAGVDFDRGRSSYYVADADVGQKG